MTPGVKAFTVTCATATAVKIKEVMTGLDKYGLLKRHDCYSVPVARRTKVTSGLPCKGEAVTQLYPMDVRFRKG